MSSDIFTKDNLDMYLKELAKEYRRLNGKSMPAEIVLVGGAAILTNYGFRDMTADIDAIIHAASSMKEAINHVGDKFDLPNKWLNSDFMRTDSYSQKLDEVSVYYRTFYGVLTVRTIKDEYLIAMKLRSGRKYKNDLSDIIGILAEREKQKHPITMQDIDAAVVRLYGGWEEFPEDSEPFIEKAITAGGFSAAYALIKEEEKESREMLINFEKEHEHILNKASADDILRELKERQKR